MNDYLIELKSLLSHDKDLIESVSNRVSLIKDNKLVIYDELEKGFEDIFKI